MPRQKNVVTKTVIDLSDPASIKRVAQALKTTTGEVRRFVGAVMPLIKQELETEVFNKMIDALRMYPPRHLGMKMRWASPKQRRYVLMKLRKENNLPYKRTKHLAEGWHCDVTIDPKSGAMTARTYNDATSESAEGKPEQYMKFVQGNIGLGTSAKSVERYDKPIQPFHKDRGWMPAQPVIQAAYSQATVLAKDRFENGLMVIVKKAAA